MSMKPYQEKLEGGYRLIRIRDLKRAILLFIFILALAGWAYIWWAGGSGLKPFYAPFDAVLPWLLIMLLTIMATGIVFRDLEIRYAKREGQRYLMADNSMRRAIWAVVLSIVIILVLALPQTSSFASTALTQSKTQRIAPGGSLFLTFSNQDSLGLTKTDWFSLSTEGSTVSAEITINGEARPGLTIFPGQPKPMSVYSDGDTYAAYSVSVTNIGMAAADLTFVNHARLAPTLTFAVPIIMFLFIIVNVAWITRLMPIKQKYASASIYSFDYAQKVDSGEAVFTKRDIRKEAWGLQTTSEAPPPEGADAAPLPPPPPEPVPAAAASADAGSPPQPAPPPIARPPEPFMAEAPKAFEVFLEDGSKLFTLGDYEGAMKNFDAALGIEPSNITALLAKGNALHRMSRLEEALVAFDRVLFVESGNERALRSKAQILFQMKQWPDAVKAIDACLRVKPADPEALGMKGDSLMEMGRRAEAALAYETALNLRPDDQAIMAKLERARLDVAAILSSAMVSTASGDYPRALTKYDDILRLEPNNTRALAGRAGVLRRTGRKEEAITALDAVLQIEPENPGALLEKAKLLIEAERTPEAVESVGKLIKVAPNDARSWLVKGDLMADQGNYAEARASYTQSLSLEPGNPEAARKIEMVEKMVSGTAQSLLSRELDQLKGIGPAKVRSLFEAGFKTVDDLKKATVDQLVAVKGISRKLAEEIAGHFNAGQTVEKPPEAGTPPPR